MLKEQLNIVTLAAANVRQRHGQTNLNRIPALTYRGFFYEAMKQNIEPCSNCLPEMKNVTVGKI